MNRTIIWITIVVGVAMLMYQPASDRQSDSSLPASETTMQAPTTTSLTNTPATPLRITVIGDSLTVGTVKYMHPDNESYRIKINARNGRALNDAPAVIDDSIGQTDVFVIALGTNDCVRNPDDRQIRNLIRASTKTSSPKPTTLLTLGENGRIRDCAVRFNRVASQLASSVSNLRVGDWQSLIKDHLEWYGKKGDNILLTPNGYKARAEWLSSLIGA